jgi:hypothetical protein
VRASRGRAGLVSFMKHPPQGAFQEKVSSSGLNMKDGTCL